MLLICDLSIPVKSIWLRYFTCRFPWNAFYSMGSLYGTGKLLLWLVKIHMHSCTQKSWDMLEVLAYIWLKHSPNHSCREPSVSACWDRSIVIASIRHVTGLLSTIVQYINYVTKYIAKTFTKDGRMKPKIQRMLQGRLIARASVTIMKCKYVSYNYLLHNEYIRSWKVVR